MYISSDQSAEWRHIPDDVKQEIGLNFDSDGEFWMSFHDWSKHFDRIEICNLSPDSLSEEQISGGKKKWEMSVFEGEWIQVNSLNYFQNCISRSLRN